MKNVPEKLIAKRNHLLPNWTALFSTLFLVYIEMATVFDWLVAPVPPDQPIKIWLLPWTTNGIVLRSWTSGSAYQNLPCHNWVWNPPQIQHKTCVFLMIYHKDYGCPRFRLSGILWRYLWGQEFDPITQGNPTRCDSFQSRSGTISRPIWIREWMVNSYLSLSGLRTSVIAGNTSFHCRLEIKISQLK